MKTISLEEARRLATLGKLATNGINDLRISGNPADAVGQLIASCGIGGLTDKECRANAALLAHRWNTHDELVEELDGVLEWLLTGKVDGVGYDDAAVALSVKAVLARAKTVEMP